MSTEPNPDVSLDEDCEAIRVRVSLALMVAGALELLTRLAREIDPELHQLLGSAHGQALHAMSRQRIRWRETRQAIRKRE